MNNKELAIYLARKVFEAGDLPTSPCTRIEFKCGKWPSNETAAGGLVEEALARLLTELLDKVAP